MKYRSYLIKDITLWKATGDRVLRNWVRSWEEYQKRAGKELDSDGKEWEDWHDRLTEEICLIAREYL